MLSQPFQYLFFIYFMRNCIFWINNNVIEIYNDVDIQLLRQYIININLKERWGVC